MEALAEEVQHPSTGFTLKDRKFKLKEYKDCFVGNEAVDWLVREKGVTKREAVELGETLRLDGYLVNSVYRDQPFLDGHFFYRFCIPRRLSDESLAKGPPLVFINGLKGAHLHDTTDGQRKYLSKSAATGLATPNLALPLQWEAGVQARDNLVATEPIDKLLGVTVYGDFLEMARGLGRPFHCFSYDWRRDNHENVELFAAFLHFIHKRHNKHNNSNNKGENENEKENTNEERERKEEEKHEEVKIQVVAHSNGGLITLCVLNKYPELFHSVVFAGTPFEGGVGILSDLHLGSSIGFNKRLIGKPVSFSFPTSYIFFPTDPTKSHLLPNTTTISTTDSKKSHHHRHTHHLLFPHHRHRKKKEKNEEDCGEDEGCNGNAKEEGEKELEEERDDMEQLPCNFFDVSEWKKNRWGLYYGKYYKGNHFKIALHKREKEGPTDFELSEEQQEHLRNCLEQGRTFRELLVCNKDITYPPIAVLVGRGCPTLSYLIKDGPKSFGGWDFATASKVDGDGRVSTKGAIPPEGIPHTVYFSDLEHSALLSDPVWQELLQLEA